MRIIGLTGGSGCGKSTAGMTFAECGIPVFSADDIYREITSSETPCCIELKAEFGDVLDENGALDRKRLFELVFYGDGSKERVLRLNSITHKYVIEEFDNRAKALDGKCDFVVFDAPLLIECGYNKKCDAVVSVLSDREIRISRLMRRDSLDRDAICARLNAQKKDIFYISSSDYIIYNNGDADTFGERIRLVIEKIKGRFGK